MTGHPYATADGRAGVARAAAQRSPAAFATAPAAAGSTPSLVAASSSAAAAGAEVLLMYDEGAADAGGEALPVRPSLTRKGRRGTAAAASEEEVLVRALRPQLTRPAVVARLLALLSAELHAALTSDEEQREEAMQWLLRRPGVTPRLKELIHPAEVPDSELERRGWPQGAFHKCQCELRCMRGLAQDKPELLDELSHALREALASAASAKAATRARPAASIGASTAAAAACGCSSLWCDALLPNAGCSSRLLGGILTCAIAAAPAATAAEIAAEVAVDAKLVEKVELAVDAKLQAHGCCTAARLGFVGHSRNWLYKKRKRADGAPRLSKPAGPTMSNATEAVRLPCCASGCAGRITAEAAAALQERFTAAHGGAEQDMVLKTLLWDEEAGRIHTQGCCNRKIKQLFPVSDDRLARLRRECAHDEGVQLRQREHGNVAYRQRLKQALAVDQDPARLRELGEVGFACEELTHLEASHPLPVPGSA